MHPTSGRVPSDALAELERPGDRPAPARLAADVVAALRRTVRGRVLFPRDLGYAAALVDRDRVVHRPGAVVEIADAADAAAVVRVAHDFDVSFGVRVRGDGGATSPGIGILVSTSALRTIDVGPGGRVRVGAGVGARELSAVLRPQGLVVPVHDGGPGHGYRPDAVRGFEVVTLDGHCRRVDHDSDPELFRTVRDGRSGVAIVLAVGLQAAEVIGRPQR